MSNRVPHVNHPNDTPYRLFHNTAPTVPHYKFGECVLAMSKPNGHSGNKRLEYCIFIRNDHHHDNVVYNPSTGNLLSRHAIEKSEVYPSEWKWIRRPEMLPTTIPNVIAPTPIDVINNQNMTTTSVSEANNS
jgi:hypothetical protein